MAKYVVQINGNTVQYRDGAVINFTYNESLDSGTIVIPNVSSKLNIKRNDIISITKVALPVIINKFLIAGFEWELEQINTPTYTYTISLISLTMKLQDDLFPNISITQSLGSTKRTIYWEIQRLNKILGDKYLLHSTLQQKTNNSICPEMQWNKRNFWEILNDLLTVVNCVVTMTNETTISCLDLNAESSAISTNDIIEQKYHEDANEYCTELEMNAENIVGDNVTTTSNQWVTPRSSEYILTTQNAQIILDNPIYYINKVFLKVKLTDAVAIKFKVDGAYDSTPNYYTTYSAGTEFLFDITQFVVEEEVYATKQVFSYIFDPVDEFSDAIFDMKKYFLKYKLGSSIIDALSYYDTKYLGIAGQVAIYNIIDFCILEYWYTHDVAEMEQGHIYTPYDIDKDSDSYPDLRTLLFNVNYVSLNSVRFRTQKENSSGLNHKVLANNQNASYVDAKALGLSEQANANRIGNPYYEIVIKNHTPSVNEYYQDGNNKYYLAEYSMQLNNIGDVYFKGVYVKNFIRKNLFTGINSKARYTSIAKESEALLRQDIYNMQLTLTSESTGSGRSSLRSYLLKNLGKKKTLYAFLKTYDYSNNQYNAITSGVLILPTSCYLIGNNKLIIVFKFEDNVSAGMHIESTSTNAYVCQGTKYVNDDGEFEKIEFSLLDESESETAPITRGQKYPMYYKNGVQVTAIPDTANSIIAKKDNREIYSVCVDLKIDSTKGVRLYPLFYELLPMIYNQESAKAIYLYFKTQNDEYFERVYFDGSHSSDYFTNLGTYIEINIELFCTDQSVAISDIIEYGFCTSVGTSEKILSSNRIDDPIIYLCNII